MVYVVSDQMSGCSVMLIMRMVYDDNDKIIMFLVVVIKSTWTIPT